MGVLYIYILPLLNKAFFLFMFDECLAGVVVVTLFFNGLGIFDACMCGQRTVGVLYR